MWKCIRCGESVDDSFDVCWSCGTSSDGIPDLTFRCADATEMSPAPENLAMEEVGTRPGDVVRHVEENLVTVATCSLAAEAHALRVQLDAANIPVLLADEFTVTMDWLLSNAVGGIKVQVPESRAEEAREVLERARSTADDDEEEW